MRVRHVLDLVTTREVAVAICAVLMPCLVVAAVVVPASAAGRRHQRPPQRPAPQLPLVTTPPPIDPALFAAAAKRPPAAAPLHRLPTIDLAAVHVSGIPAVAATAYVRAAKVVNRTDPGCHMRWWLLAGIGFVESDHAASGGSTRAHWNGVAKPPIYGPLLDGHHGFAAIHDSDGGRLDGSKKWDRAVGPMQFLPSTWQSWGDDAHGRMSDPQNIRAAALAAARYLCAGSLDLSKSDDMAAAVYSYNHSFDYVRLVLSVAARYAGLDPNKLGVDRLPHDKPKKAANKRRRSPSPSPTASSGAASAGPAPSDESSSASTTATTPSPSTTPTAAPAAPSPSPSLPSLPPPTFLG